MEKAIYENDTLKILENDSTSIYSVEMKRPSMMLINSLVKTKLIGSSMVAKNYSRLKFNASSVKSLTQFHQDQQIKTGSSCLSISVVANMLLTLSTQLNYLIQEYSHTIMGYTEEHIMVINEDTFVVVCDEYFTEIANSKIQIRSPFTKTDFNVSPEMLKIERLPTMVHFKTSYFSLGCLLLLCLSTREELYKEYLMDKKVETLIEGLDGRPIKGTKLYWTILRCLDEVAKNRTIILI